LSKPLLRRTSESDAMDDPSYLLKDQGHVPFRCDSLDFPISLAEDDSTLYIRTSDLGKLGVLNSDWVSFFSTHFL
jgi:hypothetical protein